MSAFEKAVVVVFAVLYCALSAALPLWAGLNVSLWYMAAWIVLLPQCALLLYFVLAMFRER